MKRGVWRLFKLLARPADEKFVRQIRRSRFWTHELRPTGEAQKSSDFVNAAIEENWETIRDEAIELWSSRCFESISEPGQSACYDIGFRTSFRYSLRKYYLKWYGCTRQSAIECCAKTVRILSKIPLVRGAMLTILPVCGKLTRHVDSQACLLFCLRYCWAYSLQRHLRSAGGETFREPGNDTR